MASIGEGMKITAVVTGATGGIGGEIVRGLVRSRATVVAGVRDVDRGELLRRELANEPGGGGVEILPLDIASMKSVRDFAGAVAEAHPSLQLLINNAGAWFNERLETSEGHELTLATNVLGAHLLSHLLLPQLRAGSPARIVNIVSSAVGDLDPGDLEWKRRGYDGFKAYKQSKQALTMSTWSLARSLAGSGVVANAVSPGFVKTGFLDNANGFVAGLLKMTMAFAVTPEKGAETPLWVALSPDLAGVSGRYFENRKEKKAKFGDPAALEELDALLDKLTGLSATPARV